MPQGLLDQILKSDTSANDVWHQLVFSADEMGLLRSIAAQSVQRFPSVVPLKTFNLVGAFDFKTIDYNNIDRQRFLKLCVYLLRSGLPLSPELTVHASNFMYGEDYLKTTGTSDVTVVCNIPLDDPQFMRGLTYVDLDSPRASFIIAKHQFDEAVDRTKSSEAIYRSVMDATPFVSVKNIPKAWENRLAMAKSKLVISYFSGLEVDLDRLNLPGYSSLGRLSLHDPFRDPTAVHDIQLPGHCNCQIMGHDEYIRTAIFHARTHVDTHTGKPQLKIEKRGTEIGTAIYKRAMDLMMQDFDHADDVSAQRPDAPNEAVSAQIKPKP